MTVILKGSIRPMIGPFSQVKFIFPIARAAFFIIGKKLSRVVQKMAAFPWLLVLRKVHRPSRDVDAAWNEKCSISLFDQVSSMPVVFGLHLGPRDTTLFRRSLQEMHCLCLPRLTQPLRLLRRNFGFEKWHWRESRHMITLAPAIHTGQFRQRFF